MPYIQIQLNEEHFQKVDGLCENMPVWRLSYRGEDANPVGVLGEIVVENWLHSEGVPFIDERGETTHDYRLPNDDTFDVKTKDRTVPPQAGYVATAPHYNHSHQRPSFFIFVSLLRPKGSSQDDIRNFTHAFIVGACTFNHFEAHSVFKAKGEIDGSNKLPIKFDCHNIYLNKLALPEVFISEYVRVNFPLN